MAKQKTKTVNYKTLLEDPKALDECMKTVDITGGLGSGKASTLGADTARALMLAWNDQTSQWPQQIRRRATHRNGKSNVSVGGT
jgi:hypothetical protein